MGGGTKACDEPCGKERSTPEAAYASTETLPAWARYPRVFAQVESGNRHGTIGNPMAGLFTRRQHRRARLRLACRWRAASIRGIAELQIEAGHLQPAVGIPGPAGADVEQPGSGFREHIASIDEVQINLLAGAQRLRKNDRDQIVAPPRQLRAFERLIVNELHRTAVRFYFADLQEAGQFEEHGSLARPAELQVAGWRRHRAGWAAPLWPGSCTAKR